MTKFERFPRQPGVYLFKDPEQNIIYIGKATCLRDRVRSYFGKEQQYDLKVHSLLEEHHSIDYVTTQSEMEASLLEAHLIYKQKPKFNVLLKNGQPFLYILFTKGQLPSMEIVRNKKKKGIYFGPFLHKSKARSVYNFLTKIFCLNLCNQKIDNGCLAFHIGTCAGNCRKDFDAENYRLRLQLAMDVLKGNHKEFVKKIKTQISLYSKMLEFEKAQRLHEYLINLDYIFKTIKLRFSPSKYAADMYIALNPFTPCTQNQILTQKPATGLQENVELVHELQDLLNLDAPAHSIDCFDISHFQGDSLVGSCIRFTDNKPDKNKFRRFQIRTLTQQNDYAALQEIVSRRYKNREDLPDIILIDGGKGQLNAVQKLELKTTCISLAKKEETLFCAQFPNGIKLDIKTDIGQLLIALRDYAHHFAISYHRLRRKKEF